MTDEIKAGQYELVAARFDQPTSKPNEPFEFKRHVRGDLVTLDAEDARRLVEAGAVVKPGELQRLAAEQARLAYEAALAALPDHIRAEVLGTPDEDDDQAVVVDADGVKHTGVLPLSSALQRPKRTAPKADWLAYRGVPEDQAESVSIGRLQDDAAWPTAQAV